MESAEPPAESVSSERPPPPVRRVLLVGFMGSGKSTVGRLLAERLGWTFVDFDERITSRLGRPVERIFRELGEDEFRRVEAEVGRELLEERDVVLAAGGGWAARPGRLEDLPPGTLTVWLRVSAAEALRRVREGGEARPLLQRPDALAEARRLLDERRPYYERARLSLDAEKAPARELARRIERHVRN